MLLLALLDTTRLARIDRFLPNVTPENIKIATNVVFNNTGPVPYTTSVQIPKGEFALELLNVSVKEYGGAQYDRPLYVFANGVPLFWGSTQEIANSTAVSDVTLFEKLLQGSVSFEIVLVNYYYAPAGITGVYSVNVSLLLYPGAPPAGLPNEFVPLWVNRFGYSAITLSSLSPSYTQSLELPNGTQRALALVYTEGGRVRRILVRERTRNKKHSALLQLKACRGVQPLRNGLHGRYRPLLLEA